MNRLSFPPLRRLGRFAFLAIIPCFMAVGCQGWGTVSGKIVYKDKPIPGGSIQFMGSDGALYPAQVSKDGTYTVKVPSGEAQVLISCIDDEAMVAYNKALSAQGKGAAEPGKPPPKLPKMPASGTFSLIPERYANFATSGLKVPIKTGANPMDFVLKDN